MPENRSLDFFQIFTNEWVSGTLIIFFNILAEIKNSFKFIFFLFIYLSFSHFIKNSQLILFFIYPIYFLLPLIKTKLKK
jgi:hypothetical protein